MKPIVKRDGLGLWHSPHDGGYYWQDKNGAGDRVSKEIYKTVEEAVKALKAGKVKMK